MDPSSSEARSTTQFSFSSNFPDEIMFEILSRLPVKYIIQLKLVSKPWCLLFSDPTFIEMHLKHAVSITKGFFIVKHLSDLVEEEVEELGGYTHVQKVRKEIYSLRSHDTYEELGKLKVPVPSKTDYYQIVGSSNGLICLIESNSVGRCVGLNLYLWNPSIKKFNILPKFFVNRFTGPVMVIGVGFAFQPKTNDYKVVRMVYFKDDQTVEVEVYSLRTNSWRKVEANVPFRIRDEISQVNVNGSLHWMAIEEDEKGKSIDLIVSFDINADTFSRMLLPDFGVNKYSEKTLSMYREYFAVMVNDPFSRNNDCDVWLTKDYGVRDSWAKQFVIQQGGEIMRPIGFLGNGEVIMEKSNGGLILSDIHGITTRSLHVLAPTHIIEYKATLVSPMG